MKGQLVVDEPAEYENWLKEQASLAAPAPASAPPGQAPSPSASPAAHEHH
jgi:hypothetical protein